jgi:teichuronic acid biosynthesis glycosyltransferase TuaH
MPTLDCDIIFFALARWDGPYSSTAYSLAKALSKHTRVFFVDNPFTIKDLIIHRHSAQIAVRRNALWKGKDLFLHPDKNYPDLVVVTPRVTLSINWLPPGRVYDFFSKINDYALSAAINETCESFAIKKYILVNSFNPLFGRFLDLSQKPALTIYQSVDNISHSSYIRKHGPALEKQAIQVADFTIVTSSELQRLKSAISDDVHLIPNAANTVFFNKAVTEPLEKPKELQDIPPGKKIICYTGNICHRLDYDLLIKVATHHPDRILLMVGPFANDQYKTSGLAALPNVIFTGRKSMEELPAYLKHADCCIIPFLCNELTKSIYPLKINEYLSAGKPVVSTAFSVDIRSFKSVSYISENHDEFVADVETAIQGDTPDQILQRVNFSSGNTWSSRAHHFIDLTQKYLGENDRPGRKPKLGAGIQAVYK